MRELPPTDVVIVGLGAAGGVAANVFAQAGLKVVGIEAGPRVSNADFIKRLDEISGCFVRNELGDYKYNKELPSWRPDEKTPAGDPAFVWKMMNAVGGSTIHYGTQSWRFSPGDFKVRSQTVARYGEAALPKGSTMADWPVTYDEMEPYYDRVEYGIGVSGKGGANPFEGPRSRDYPMPPLRETGYTNMARDAMRSLGYHPFPQPAAINSVNYDGRAACTYCGVCSGFGCWNDSKSSTLVSVIRDAEATGNLEIRPLCAVTRILIDSAGRATGVQYRTETGEVIEQPAKFVVLSSYVYENVRRLLLSRSAKFPNGLSNNHGQVGKHYLAHLFTVMSGLFPGKKLNTFNGSNGQAIAIDDLNGDNYDHKDAGFIRGAIVMTFNHNLPIGITSVVPPDVPSWGQGYKDWIRDNVNSTGLMYAQVETLPYDSNYLDLDPDKKDAFGEPVIRVTYDIHENEKRSADFITQKLTQILTKMGATKTWFVLPPIPMPVNSHAYGGTRMGNDPASSVVNGHCISHEVPNLAILGGSTFVSATGYNPTETIQALSWRSAEYIVKNFVSLTA